MITIQKTVLDRQTSENAKHSVYLCTHFLNGEIERLSKNEKAFLEISPNQNIQRLTL